MSNSLPTFVFWLCGCSAVLLIALALPMWLRRVPPNRLYGARFAATLASPEVWYTINARAGRNLILIGVGYGLLIGALAMSPRLVTASALLGVTAIFLAALIVNAIMLRRGAAQLSRTTGYTDAR